jgi:hypothetical protein
MIASNLVATLSHAARPGIRKATQRFFECRLIRADITETRIQNTYVGGKEIRDVILAYVP